MNIKTRDQATRDAIQKFLEDGGRVKLRDVDAKKVRRDTWQGAKITVGFRFKHLTDRG